MPNLFSGINVALRALLTHQQAIEVIEHNVANANTPGYRRQEAVLTTSLPYGYSGVRGGSFPGQVGSGVIVDSIRQFKLDFFDGRYQRELAESKRWETQSDVLQQVESTLAETGDDGLIPKLDAFWSGWQALSNDPSNMALRADVRARADALTQAFNGKAKALMAIQNDQNLAINQRVDEINTIASQVARLNGEISQVKASGNAPNDLIDQRDTLIDRLAEISGATTSTQEDGTMLVSIGGHALVVGTTAFSLDTAISSDPSNPNKTLINISWVDDNQPLNVARGELAGLIEVRNNLIPEQLDGLNKLAFELATQVNNLHQTGYGLNGNTGAPPPGNPPGYDGNFFDNFVTSDYALEIKLSGNLDDLNNIAAATSAGAPGDGNNAIAMANLQQALVMNGGTTTLNQYYTGQVGQLGLELKNATANAQDRKTVADSLASLQESVSGVSLDEEAANLVKSQRAFQAASRMLTAVDDMLDRIINGMGTVGR